VNARLVAVLAGQYQRRRAILHLHIDCRATLDQRAKARLMPALAGKHQRRHTILPLLIDRRATLHQRVNARLVAVLAGQYQRRRAILHLHIDCRATLDQRANARLVAVLAGHHQRRIAIFGMAGPQRDLGLVEHIHDRLAALDTKRVAHEVEACEGGCDLECVAQRIDGLVGVGTNDSATNLMHTAERVACQVEFLQHRILLDAGRDDDAGGDTNCGFLAGQVDGLHRLGPLELVDWQRVAIDAAHEGDTSR